MEKVLENTNYKITEIEVNPFGYVLKNFRVNSKKDGTWVADFADYVVSLNFINWMLEIDDKFNSALRECERLYLLPPEDRL